MINWTNVHLSFDQGSLCKKVCPIKTIEIKCNKWEIRIPMEPYAYSMLN